MISEPPRTPSSGVPTVGANDAFSAATKIQPLPDDVIRALMDGDVSAMVQATVSKAPPAAASTTPTRAEPTVATPTVATPSTHIPSMRPASTYDTPVPTSLARRPLDRRDVIQLAVAFAIVGLCIAVVAAVFR